MAAGAGAEDFKLGKKEELPMIDVIDDNAFYYDDLVRFSIGSECEKTS